MKGKTLICFMLLAATLTAVFAEDAKPARRTDLTVTGQAVCNGKPLPMVTVVVKGTTIGTATDNQGKFQLHNLPEGVCEIEASCLGYRSVHKTIQVAKGETVKLHFDLQEDLLEMDAVVVTGDKTAMLRREASTIVNTISPKLMLATTSRTVSEGLPFIPGVRMENNCQNCGFNQVRLNGMEGPYSQILVDGHPIFSGLLGVYGMELLPSNIIERIEVQRGGASSLYGSNAVAGTVNLILQDPMVNTLEAGLTTSLTGVGTDGEMQPDYSVSVNSSTVTKDNRTGLVVFGNYRHREPYDDNGDGFSEMPRLRNTTIGARLFQRIGQRGKIAANYFHINEDRRGGNKFDNPEHHADIAEALRHHVDVGTVNYTQLFREQDQLATNVSFQHVYRNSFYGGMGAPSDTEGVLAALGQYGVSKDWTYNIGTQYNAHIGKMHTLLIGVDITGEHLRDEPPPYSTFSVDKTNAINVGEEPQFVTGDQSIMTTGGYCQYTFKWKILSLTAGARFDYYNIKDNEHSGSESKIKSSFVPVPRLSALVNILPDLQMRMNYSMGYRAPQLYDEDLHVNVAGTTQIKREIDPDLQRETSHSGMLSFDYNHQYEHLAVGLLLEGFYTRLQNAFINTFDGEVYTRSNYSPGAYVGGLNMECNLAPARSLAFKFGGTYQKSQYLGTDEEIGEQNSGQRDFIRSPNLYGFFLTNWKVYKGFSIDFTFNLTGPMRVLYETTDIASTLPREGTGNSTGPKFDTRLIGEWVKDTEGGGYSVRESKTFYDMGFKLNYDFDLPNSCILIFAGVKNILNSYQKDFDLGAGRSSAYVYGPMIPRTVFVGVKIGDFL